MNRTTSRLTRISLTFFVGVALAAASVAPSAHAAENAEGEIAAAESAYAQVAYDDAIKKVEGVIKTGGLTHQQLNRAHRILALSRAGADQPDKARDAFTDLLATDPDFALDASYGPKIQQPFLEARGFWQGQSSKPGLEVSPLVREGEGGTLRVTMRDPTHLVEHAVVAYRWGTAAPFKRVEIALGEQTVPVPAPPAGISRLDYFAQAFDAHNDAVFELGNESVPRTSLIELGNRSRGPSPVVVQEKRGLLSKPLFWVITGAIVAAGVTTGILLATRKHDTRDDVLPPNQSTVSPVLMCGGSPCR